MAEVENSKLALEHRMKLEMDQLRTAMTFKVCLSMNGAFLIRTKAIHSNMREKHLAEDFQMLMPASGNARQLGALGLQGRRKLSLGPQNYSIRHYLRRKRLSSGLWFPQLFRVRLVLHLV